MEQLPITETQKTECKLQSFIYTSPEEALMLYCSLTEKQKTQMAEVYKDAFGGYPWFERYICDSCNAYCADSCCPNCSSLNLPEAYPTSTLIGEYFPKMLSGFTPGLLILAYDQNNDVIGFSTGGMVKVEDFVNEKYSDNPLILNDIYAEFGLLSNDMFFYDNETCLAPKNQRAAIGQRLGAERLRIANEVLQANAICGRTVNLKWLRVKQRQFQEACFSFKTAKLNNDKYEVQGVPRILYLSMRESNKIL